MLLHALLFLFLAAGAQTSGDAVTAQDDEARREAARADVQAARDLASRHVAEREALELRIADARLALEAEADAAPLPTAPEVDVETATSEDVDALLRGFEERRSDARSRLDEARAERERLEDRRAELPVALAEVGEGLEQLDRESPPEAAPDAPTLERELAALARERVEASRAALAERERVLQVEAQGLDALAAAAALEERAAARRLERLEEIVAGLDQARAEVLGRESERERERAQEQAREAALQSSELANEAAINIDLADEFGALSTMLKELARLEPEARGRLEELRERKSDTEDRVERVGLTDAVGLHLRQERLSLGDARQVRVRLREIESELAALNLRKIELRPIRQRLPDRGDWIDARFAELPPGSAAEALEARRVARDVAGEVWDTRRRNLDAVWESTTKAIDDYFQLQIDERAYLEALLEYQEYVEERVLWVRSAVPIWQVPPGGYVADLARITDAERWSKLGEGLAVDTSANLPRVLLGAVIVALLFALRPIARRRLTEEAELVRQRTQVSLRPTLRAALWTLLLASAPAAVAWLVAWRVGSVLDQGPWAGALGDGCARAAMQVAILSALRAVLTKDGLAEAHFEWRDSIVRATRRDAAWLFAVLPPATFLGEFLGGLDGSEGADAIGRIATLFTLLATGRFVWRLLHPERGALTPRDLRPDLLRRLRRLWFVLGVGVVVALGALTLAGYVFSARQLFERFELTLALVFVVVVCQAIAEQGLLLARKREAFERLRRRREELRLERERELEARRAAGEDVAEIEGEDEGLNVSEDDLDFGALTEDAGKLVRTSAGVAMLVLAYFVWSSALPALGALDNVRLWTERVPGVDGTTVTSAPVTLRNLVLALAVVVLGTLATRSLPSVLEIAVLRRFDLASGERHAITTLVRYAVTILVAVLAFDQLGVPWSKAQWLVAGVSVGLGFGLQEIFANFVSGLLLLFERPIRVGDWVTLGDVEGVVSKIRIRATTIRDRDLKELVVPNKEFVTGRFINWTLSDPITRVVCPVGIAYGSDVDRAAKLLLECGRQSPYQVEEPGPNVVFKDFGSSSLDFELRVFVSGRDIQPRVVHDLHVRVDRAFREAGIEIAFPQRDLNVRNIGPLVDLLAPERRPE